MSLSRPPSIETIALSLASLWLVSVAAMSIAIAATPLYQPGSRLGLCTPCAVAKAKTVVAKIDPANAG